MKPDWQFVLNQTSIEFFLACKARERTLLLKGLQDLAADPYQRGDYGAKDSTGRPIEIKLTERFFITFWLDGSVKELRVINIERV